MSSPMPPAQRPGWAAFLALLFLACVFLLGVIRVHDPDTWTHLSFGRWIWEHKALPPGEPFIDTGAPFSYNNWLFGLIYYLAFLAGGYAGVVLLKAALITLVFALLLRLSLVPRGNLVISVLVLAGVAVSLRVRFVERPDTLMMLFLAYTVFSLQAFAHGQRKFLYFTPAVSLLWANAHTSILLMLLPFGSFLAGGLVQRYLEARDLAGSLRGAIGFAPGLSPGQLRVIALAAAASFAASLASPYFLDQYLHSVGALQSDWWKQSIGELRRPTWEVHQPLYLFTAAVVLSYALNRRRISVPEILLAMPLLAMPFMALRFIWFTAITGALLARNLSELALARELPRRLLCGRPATALAAAAVAALAPYTLLPAAGQAGFQAQRFGLGVNHDFTPEGCLRYLDQRGVTGRVLNTFYLGGYITWRDFPRRVPFMDGRGFRDDDLLERATMAPVRPHILDELRGRHPFESVVLVQLGITPAFLREVSGSDVMLGHPDWELAYWDDTCYAYLRRGGPHQAALDEDRYRYLIPSSGIQPARMADPAYRDGVAEELGRTARDTGSSMAHALTGVFHNELRQYDQAIAAFARVEGHPAPRLGLLYEAYLGMAYAHYQKGNAGESIRYHLKALDLSSRLKRPSLSWDWAKARDPKESASLHQRLAITYAASGDAASSIHHFETAIELNPGLPSVYPQLIALYQRQGRSGDVERVTRLAEGARQAGAAQAHFVAGTRAYVEKDYPRAVSELSQSIAENPGHPAAYSNLGYVYYDTGDLEKAMQYHRRALELDAGSDLSHYGIALVYRDQGNKDKAREHWTEYLRLQPEGYYSRKAKKELESLR